MSDLILGKNSKQRSVNTDSIKAGIKKEQFKDDAKLQTIFDSIDGCIDGKKDGVIDAEEMAQFKQKLMESAGKDETLSTKEAGKFLKKEGIKNIDKKELFEILEQLSQSGDNIEQSTVVEKNGQKFIIIKYKDGSVETINPDKSSQIASFTEGGGAKTAKYNKNHEVTEETVETEDGRKAVTSFKNGKATETVITDTNKPGVTSTVKYDAEENPVELKVETGSTEENYTYVDGKPQLTSKIENKGLPAKEVKTEYTYNDDGTTTEISVETKTGNKTTTIKNGDTVVSETKEEAAAGGGVKRTESKPTENGREETVAEGENNITKTTYNKENKALTQTKTVDGQEYNIEYDGNGNTKVVLQNGETLDALAKKFGCTKQELLDANGGKIRGWAGDDIVVPGELQADDARLQGRQTKEEAVAAYKVVAEEIQQVKDEAAARKPIKFNNKDYDTYEEMARALFKREGNDSPSKRQMKARIEDLKKTNPEIKDGELKGKRITANVAQEMQNRIAGKEKSANEYKQNVETRKQSESIAKSFYKIADDNSGYTSMKKMQELLDTQVTEDNITAVLDAYDKEKQGDSSIIDTVTSEVMPSGDRRTQKQVLRTIMSKLSDAARKAGVTDKDIEKANLDFEASLTKEYDSMGGAFRRTNPKDMEKAVDFLRGAIVAKQTGNVEEMSDEDAIAVFNSDFAANDADAQKQYSDAREEEGWTAKVGDTVCGWFGCTTIDDMDKKLGKNAADVKKLAAAAGNETEFKKIYKEVFGIEFDKNKIAARDAALGNLQQAQNMSSTINITSGILKKSGSLDYSGLRDEVKTKFQFDDNTVDSVIQSYAQTIGKDASTDDAKKQMLMRFLEETQYNATEEYRNLTKGKTIEQMNNDLDLLTKSAFGTNDIVKDVIQFNENQQTTEMITDAAFEIAGTIALQAVPGLGQMAAARLALSAAKWGTKAVKVINYAAKAEKAFATVNKFQKVNKARQIGTQMANAGVATAAVEASSGKDAKTVMRKTLMNMSFAGVGAGSSMLAPKLMQSFGITNRALANEIAEEIINAAGSYGVTKVAGDDYGTQDAFVDFATGIIMSRLSHVKTPASKGVQTDVTPVKTGAETSAPNHVNPAEHNQTLVTDKKVSGSEDVQTSAAGEKKASQIKEEVQPIVTNPEPATVKTKTEQHDDVLSMLQDKAKTGKGLSPDDFKLVSEYIETITDNSELKEITGLLGGKKMTSSQKKQLKEALAAKTESLKNSAPAAEPVKTETKKSDSPEVEEVVAPKEKETPAVHEEVEIVEVNEPVNTDKSPAATPVEPVKGKPVEGTSDAIEVKIVDETPAQPSSDVSVKAKAFKEMDNDELIAEYQRLRTEQDESVHIWKEYGEHSVLTPTIDNTIKTNEIENLLKERGLNTKVEKIQNKPREQVQEPVVKDVPAEDVKVKLEEDLDAIPEAKVEPEPVEHRNVVNDEVPIVDVEPEPVRVETQEPVKVKTETPVTAAPHNSAHNALKVENSGIKEFNVSADSKNVSIPKGSKDNMPKAEISKKDKISHPFDSRNFNKSFDELSGNIADITNWNDLKSAGQKLEALSSNRDYAKLSNFDKNIKSLKAELAKRERLLENAINKVSFGPVNGQPKGTAIAKNQSTEFYANSVINKDGISFDLNGYGMKNLYLQDGGIVYLKKTTTNHGIEMLLPAKTAEGADIKLVKQDGKFNVTNLSDSPLSYEGRSQLRYSKRTPDVENEHFSKFSERPKNDSFNEFIYDSYYACREMSGHGNSNFPGGENATAQRGFNSGLEHHMEFYLPKSDNSLTLEDIVDMYKNGRKQEVIDFLGYEPDLNNLGRPVTPTQPDYTSEFGDVVKRELKPLEKYTFKDVKIATCRQGCSGEFDIAVGWKEGQNFQFIHKDGKTYILEINKGPGWRNGDFKGLAFEGDLPDEICQRFCEETDWNNFDLGSKKSAIDKMNDIKEEWLQAKHKADTPASQKRNTSAMSEDEYAKLFKKQTSTESKFNNIAENDVLVTQTYIGHSKMSQGSDIRGFDVERNGKNKGVIYNAADDVTANFIPSYDAVNRPGYIQIYVRGNISKADMEAFTQHLKDKGLIAEKHLRGKDRVNGVAIQKEAAEYFNNLKNKGSNVKASDTPAVETAKPKTDEAAVHYPSPEEKMAMGQIGENINRAKTPADIKKAQEWLNKMPECDQKARLQKQLNEKRGKLTPEVVNVERSNNEAANVKKPDNANEVQDAAKINQKRMEAQKAKVQSLEAKFQQDVITVNIDGQNVKVVRFKGSQEGSNPGFWIKDTKTGELSYMKYSNNSSKMSSEALASDLYNLAGVSTPKLSVVRNGKGENIGITSKFMDLQNPSAKDIQNIKEGFAADCWLANWDALKDGNVMTQNGQAVRSDVGGSLCYRARGGRKGAAFGENVNELTSFFGSNSLSKKYIEGMSKDELINSLNKVTNINDNDIAKLVDKVAGKKYSVKFNHEGNIAGYQLYGGLNNPEYVKETLIARRNYMKKFQSLCEATPMRQGETISDYVQRIQNIMPKKTYNISLGLEPAGQPKPSFENINVSSRANLGLSADEASSHFLAEHLTPSQKQLINNSCEAFRNSRGNRIRHNASNKLTTNDMLHATDVKYLDSILEKGLISREFSGESSAQINGVVQDSRTPMCADLWDVQNNMSINQYFHRSRNEWINGETNFLPNPHTEPRSGLVIVFNKNAIDPTIMNNSFKVSEGSSVMFKDGNMGGYDFYKSHRAVPVGIPSNAIDRVIVPSYGMSQLGRIKAIINKSGLDIKIYDTNGNLL